MHNAPSVSYPVGRCAFARYLWAGGLCYGLSVELGRRQLARQRGALRWQQGLCHWHAEPEPVIANESVRALPGIGQVNPVLDLQNILLLRWQPLSYVGQPDVRWFWLDRRSCPDDWLAVRRALLTQHGSGA